MARHRMPRPLTDYQQVPKVAPPPHYLTHTVKVGETVKTQILELADLPENTDLIPWPEFLVAAVRRYPLNGALVIGLAVMLAGALWIFGPAYLPATILPGLTIAVVGGVVFIAAGPFANSATRSAYVIRSSKHGRPDVDHQKWWRSDFARFPDQYKVEIGGRRSIWLDCIDGKVRPFDPWLASMPTTILDGKSNLYIHPISPAQVGGIEVIEKSTKRIAQHRESSEREALQQGAMAILTVVGLGAMFLAGQTAMDKFIGGETPAAVSVAPNTETETGVVNLGK